VTFLERFPSEGAKTNVGGTTNVLAAASEAGVERFINISTDKAADPVNVLGTTKRVAERITAYFDLISSGCYSSVRFGNVLGSNGSVIPTFMEQIKQGEPITVTDPAATRYFMTTEEAVLLVLQATALAHGGDVFVLDMGDPVSIDMLARRLSRQIAPGRVPDIDGCCTWRSESSPILFFWFDPIFRNSQFLKSLSSGVSLYLNYAGNRCEL
jgi:FlaA1/EpsC-like NDP-sugar epimerase